MNADELHAIAENLRRAYRPPTLDMDVGTHVTHEAIHALARAIDQLAEDRA